MMLLRGLMMSVVAIGALAGGGASAESPPGQYVVVMSNMNYGRLPAGVKVGDKISWVNHDTVPHTVTARDHSFDLRVGPGQSAQMVVQKAGSFPFYCIFHSTMR